MKRHDVDVVSLVFGLLFVVLAFTSPSFLSLQNGANILDQSSVLLILAAGVVVSLFSSRRRPDGPAA